MGVKIINRSYEGIHESGSTDWLLGNVGDWQTLNLKVEASIDYTASQQEPIQIDYVNRAFKLANGKSWGEYGFDNGMSVTLKYVYSEDSDSDGDFETQTPTTANYTVSNIYGSTMEVVQAISIHEFDTIPNNFGTKKITEVIFYVDKLSEGCKIKYAHVTNDEAQSANLNSFIDGSTSEFVKPNIANNGVFQQMEAIGEQSGMSIRTIEIKSNGKKAGTDSVYQYDIRINYMISSIFEDLATMLAKQQPSYLSGNGSLSDNFSIQFLPEWNNPNVKIQNDPKETVRFGNTGWFDENYNQLNNNFKIDSIQYFDLNGNQVKSLDYITQTKVKIIISGVPNLNSQTKCGFGFAWIPENDIDFKNLSTPFYRNCYLQYGKIDTGFSLGTLYTDTNYGAGVNGGAIDTDNVRFTALGDKIIMEATFIPNLNFASAFDLKQSDDRNYILWVSVADSSLTPRNFSNRVSLLADVNSLVKNIPPVGQYPYIDNMFLEHPFDETNLGVEVLEGISQDDFLCRLTFRIKKETSVFQKMEFGVEAFNIGLNYDFPLESYEVDLTQYPIDSNGIQQFNFNQIRGFKLEQGNNKNWVKIQRAELMDTVDFYGYIAYFGSKIRYEDWLLNQKTPSYFFDANELNNGFNNNWVHYLRTNGFVINFYVKINSIELNELVQFKNQFRFKFVDTDENTKVQTTHTYLRDSDNTVLNVGTDEETGRPLGVILSNEPTRIEITFDILEDGVWDIDKTYAVTTIEIDKGAGEFEMRQLSSVYGSEGDNPLKPVTGETKLKIEVDGTGKILKSSCLVDPELLQKAEKYRITGRVGCKEEQPVFSEGLYEFRYEDLYE